MIGTAAGGRRGINARLLRTVPVAVIAAAGAAFAGAAPAGAATSPVIVSSSASPTSIVIGASTTFSWEVTSSSALTENRVLLYTPNGNQLPATVCAAATQVSGTPTDGNYQTVCTIPDGDGNGIYSSEVEAMDSSGNEVNPQGPQITVSGEPISNQTITLTSTPPSGATVGGTYTPTATAGSGLPVAFTLDSTSSGCTLNAKSDLVTFVAAGTCVIDANQAGNANYNAAPQVQQSFSIIYPVTGNCSAAAGPGVDWAGCDKQGVNLAGANLSNSDMAGTNLAGANLTNVTATGSNFQNAELYAGKLSGINLSESRLGGADFSYASMSGAGLNNSGVIGAKMYGTYLAGATLNGVISGGVQGTPAALPGNWHLVNGYLVGPYANLENAKLAGTNLTGYAMYDVYFLQVNLSDANLTNANITYSTLDGANLTGATVTGTNFAGSTWRGTICPNGMTNPNNGKTCVGNGDG
jgi:uncharacterized protein YjbI with pentapeptide repeats